MKTRDYQDRSIEKIRELLKKGIKKIGFQLVTGGGKTLISKHIIISALNKNKKVFFIVRGNKLMKQTIEAFRDIPTGIIWSNRSRKLKSNFIIMSQPTYVASQKKWKKHLKTGDLFFIDEAHDCTARGYKTLLSDIPEGKVIIGLSATFIRGSSKRGHEFWEEFIYPVTGHDLRKAGWLPQRAVYQPETHYDLSKVRMSGGDYNTADLFKAVDEDTQIYGDIVTQYKKINKHMKPTIAFCINIKHAEKVAREFKKTGVIPLLIHSKLPKQKQQDFESNLKHFLDTKIPFVICSVNMLGRGVDIPQLEYGLFLRPTKSKLLYFQQAGRLTRKKSNDPSIKEVVTIIDFTKNTLMHGDFYDYIKPEDKTLAKKKMAPRVTKIRRCRECGSINPSNVLICIVCGSDLTRATEIKQDKSRDLIRTAFKIDEKSITEYLHSQIHNENKENKKIDHLEKWRNLKVKFGNHKFYASDVVPEDIKELFANMDIKI